MQHDLSVAAIAVELLDDGVGERLVDRHVALAPGIERRVDRSREVSSCSPIECWTNQRIGLQNDS